MTVGDSLFEARHERTQEEARAELAAYVRACVIGPRPINVKHLAKLVNAAPALQTLDSVEWWNVALLLAMEVDRG